MSVLLLHTNMFILVKAHLATSYTNILFQLMHILLTRRFSTCAVWSTMAEQLELDGGRGELKEDTESLLYRKTPERYSLSCLWDEIK